MSELSEISGFFKKKPIWHQQCHWCHQSFMWTLLKVSCLICVYCAAAATIWQAEVFFNTVYRSLSDKFPGSQRNSVNGHAIQKENYLNINMIIITHLDIVVMYKFLFATTLQSLPNLKSQSKCICRYIRPVSYGNVIYSVYSFTRSVLCIVLKWNYNSRCIFLSHVTP